MFPKRIHLMVSILYFLYYRLKIDYIFSDILDVELNEFLPKSMTVDESGAESDSSLKSLGSIELGKIFGAVYRFIVLLI